MHLGQVMKEKKLIGGFVGYIELQDQSEGLGTSPRRRFRGCRAGHRIQERRHAPVEVLQVPSIISTSPLHLAPPGLVSEPIAPLVTSLYPPANLPKPQSETTRNKVVESKNMPRQAQNMPHPPAPSYSISPPFFAPSDTSPSPVLYPPIPPAPQFTSAASFVDLGSLFCDPQNAYPTRDLPHCCRT
jgi:hypothetical protein